MADGCPDKRRFHRVLYQVHAELTDASGHPHPCQIVDLSLRGCLLEFSGEPALDTAGPCLLMIPLDRDNTIQMTLSLAHRHGPRLGFVCRHTDLTSFTLLRPLVELNLGDPKWLERDLNSLWELP